MGQVVGAPAAGNTSLRSNYSRIITPGVVREGEAQCRAERRGQSKGVQVGEAQGEGVQVLVMLEE